MLKYCITIGLISLALGVAAQTDTTLSTKRLMASDAIAHRITQKMTDSLQLSDTVSQRIYQLTLHIQRQKYHVLDRCHGTAALPGQMTLLEFRRDSLYATLLDPRQYQSYRSKKNALVSNN